MPELAEGVMSGTLVQDFIQSHPAGTLKVKNLLADATDAESRTHPPGSKANLGHVYCLESSCKALRGSCGSQTPLYPPFYATAPADKVIPIAQRDMTLIEAETHPRNVLLKFCDGESKIYWCQVQLLKHTVTGAYLDADWNEAICVVNKVDRGFKVGITFEFENHILAFSTLDLLIQLHWSEDRNAPSDAA
ncbi:hypothetical protein B0H14DRAFT_2473055 [Mycena olivaceomarginata]|nr:hypothetical protein B0H14DRAFT_2473055 [Mycena olivaceomarginata]